MTQNTVVPITTDPLTVTVEATAGPQYLLLFDGPWHNICSFIQQHVVKDNFIEIEKELKAMSHQKFDVDATEESLLMREFAKVKTD